jgi:hypothetical protein
MENKSVGRPRKFTDVELMQEKIDNYFKDCDERKAKYTVPGLALALGFLSRASIWDYGKLLEFNDTIKRAMLKMESQRAEDLLTENNPVGKIFDLKNNFGWKDQKDVGISGGLDVIAGIKITLVKTE